MPDCAPKLVKFPVPILRKTQISHQEENIRVSYSEFRIAQAAMFNGCIKGNSPERGGGRGKREGYGRIAPDCVKSIQFGIVGHIRALWIRQVGPAKNLLAVGGVKG